MFTHCLVKIEIYLLRHPHKTAMSHKASSMSGTKGGAPMVPDGGLAFSPVSPSGKESRKTLPHSPSPRMAEADWDGRDELSQREVQEARARAAQMEKTMRWWSDCTANWREKWSKVRNERNKAREENRQLRSKLETFVKECNSLKREKQELLAQFDLLKGRPGSGDDRSSGKGGECPDNRLTSDGDVGAADNTCEPTSAALSSPQNPRSPPPPSSPPSAPTTPQHQPTSPPPVPQPDLSQLPDKSDFMDKVLAKDSDSMSCVSETMEKIRLSRQKFDEVSVAGEESIAEEKLSLLEMKLEESQKTIQGERDEKSNLTKTIEKMQTDLNSYKAKYEEAKRLKQEAILEVEKQRSTHQSELSRVVLELEDESTSRSTMDRRLGELRKELERLQAENAAEWGKRERLETEKLSLERDNKKLRIQITDLEEQLERKQQQATAMMDSDVKTMQTELYQKNKELTELRHAHSRLRKSLLEKSTELDHTRRRAEQYELEVKKLRGRVEELKRELSVAEDEADGQGNLVRRLQRSNDELQEQVDNLQVQLEHLQSRLRSANSQPIIAARSSSLKSFDGKDGDDDVDDADSDDDDGLVDLT